eukprot:2478412-Amphidinium_carterae.1
MAACVEPVLQCATALGCGTLSQQASGQDFLPEARNTTTQQPSSCGTHAVQLGIATSAYLLSTVQELIHLQPFYQGRLRLDENWLRPGETQAATVATGGMQVKDCSTSDSMHPASLIQHVLAFDVVKFSLARPIINNVTMFVGVASN